MENQGARSMGITNRSWIESLFSNFCIHGNEETAKFEELLAKTWVHLPLSYYIKELHT